MGKIYFGFDPGGKDNFGWAVLKTGDGSTETGIASNALEAVNTAYEAAKKQKPDGVGIDAPLFWTIQGDRKADQYVRKWVIKMGGCPGNVGHVNSLRGACLVQGILTAKLIHDLFPEAKITETHPKAISTVWPDLKSFKEAYPVINQHEEDALVSAYCACAIESRLAGWCDLAELEEYEKYFPSGKAVSYWFPVQGI